MPALDHFDLPFTQERLYERAIEIVTSWGKGSTDAEWSDAIFAATAEARKVKERLH